LVAPILSTERNGFYALSKDTNTASTTSQNVTTGVATGTTGGTTGPIVNTTTTTTSGGFVTTGNSSTTGTTVDNSKCDTKKTCSDCESSSCIWCDSNSQCISGDWYGPPRDTDCSDWRWQQCKVNGKYLIVGGACFVGLVLLIILIAVCRCFCCHGKRRGLSSLKDFKEFKSTLQMQNKEERELLVSKHPKTDERRAELVKKYGSKLASRTSDGDV